MVEEEFGKSIIFEKFDLDSDEIVVAKELVEKYAHKIKNFVAYQKIKLEMKSHLKAKNKHFELKCHVLLDKDKIISEAEGRDPIALIDEVMKKALNEIEHKIKK
jgi:ribosome-associated translation inhibitor RaiA